MAAFRTSPEPELNHLSNILKTFDEQFSTLFTDTDRVAKRIRDDIAPQVAADAAYQNAKERYAAHAYGLTISAGR